MVRRTSLALVVVAACGTMDDKRVVTADYIAEAVLVPNCGQAECHSTFYQPDGYVFDTAIGAKRTLVDNALIELDSGQYDASDHDNAQLIVWVTELTPFNNPKGIGRMPYDRPLANADLELLKRWIDKGAPGARCDPTEFHGYACMNTVIDTDPTTDPLAYDLVRCTSDFGYGAKVRSCSTNSEIGCATGQCTCATNFAECDGDVTNGCETELFKDTHCTSCSDDCTAKGQHCLTKPTGTGFLCQ